MDMLITLFLMMHMCTHMPKFIKMHTLNMSDFVYIKNASNKVEKKEIYSYKEEAWLSRSLAISWEEEGGQVNNLYAKTSL